MAKLTVSQPTQYMSGGRYVYSSKISSGTITLSMSIDNEAFDNITDGVISANETKEIALPSCTLKADFSGDASLIVARID